MGIDIHALKFLAAARQSGVAFTRTIMIGRQRLYVSDVELARFVTTFRPAGPDGEYAEWLLRALGATRIDALDVSEYEGATVLHNMNEPIPETLCGQYDLVIEFGTLEHIFNFPVAIGNCMRLVATGGRILICTVANNFCGHGFYQFSPELYFRVFRPEHGFALERLLVCDAFYESAWYAVTDPEVVRGRVELTGRYPVTMLVQARKVTDVVPFRSPPQQSDYLATWSGSGTHADHLVQSESRRFRLRSLIPGWVQRRLRSYHSARQYRANHFHKLDSPGTG
jgi:SAM-dependent methyltransferase